MAPLDRTLALAKVHRVTVRVEEDLDLDVAWLIEVALDVQAPVSESAHGLARRCPEGYVHLGGLPDNADPFPAAASGGLDHHGVSDLFGCFDRLRDVCHSVRQTGDEGDACLQHLPTTRDLVPHDLDRVGRRTDPRDPGVYDCLGKLSVLCEEAIAWVDRLRA